MAPRLPLVALLALVPLALGFNPLPDTPFLQRQSYRLPYRFSPIAPSYAWEQVDLDSAVVSITQHPSDPSLSLALVESGEIYVLHENADVVLLPLALQFHPTSIATAKGALVVASRKTNQVAWCKFTSLSCKVAVYSDAVEILSCSRNDERCLIRSSNRTILLESSPSGKVVFEGAVQAAAISDDGKHSALASSKKMFRCKDASLPVEESTCKWDWIVGIGNDSPVTAIAFAPPSIVAEQSKSASKRRGPEDGFGVYFALLDHINYFSPQGMMSRMDAVNGLPANATRFAATTESAGWFATNESVVVLYGHPASVSPFLPSLSDLQQAFEFHFLHGPRWLVPGEIKFISKCDRAKDGIEKMWVVTEHGLSLLRLVPLSLEQKEKHFQEMMVSHHIRDDGLVLALSFDLSGGFGDENQKLRNNASFGLGESDGLWSGMYLGALAMKYAVTQDEETRALGWHVFSAMEALYKVTGVDGLMARSMRKKQSSQDESDSNPRLRNNCQWIDSTTMEGWQWENDTSSDTVTGHMFAYPLFHDLVAKTPEEKARVARLPVSTLHYIVKNKFYLVDYNGQKTLWGFWGPDTLNVLEKDYDERGLNSLEIQAYLLSAYMLSGSEELANAYRYLQTNGSFELNLINEKIDTPDDDNMSDDELGFLSWHPAWYSCGKNGTDELSDFVDYAIGINRHYAIVKKHRSSLWSSIFALSLRRRAAIAGEEIDESLLTSLAKDAAWDLQNYPWEYLDWSFDNSRRIDCDTNPYLDRGGIRQSKNLYPTDERSFSRWNENVFQEQHDGSGKNENDPGSWLVAYWMARFYGLLA